MPTTLTDHSLKDVTGTITDLPSAPVASIAETNSRPQTDPAMEKATLPMINELKKDMDGFHKNEYPHIKDRSDPAVVLPLTRFTGDYQRLKDEVSVLKLNPGIPSQVSIQEVSDMGANLRYLQRTYRDLANVELVPSSDIPYSRVGTEAAGGVEGFTSSSDATKPITLAQLKLLQTSISAETIRLQASGSTDPIIAARVRVFTNIGNTVNDLVTKVSNGSMAESAIPIKVSDYVKFLPALGNSSAGIGGLLSNNGLGSLSNLFNAYDAGDASGAQVAAALFEKYAKQMGDGLSFNISYTSPNELAKDQALATYATAYSASMAGARNPRGDFERIIDSIDAFESGRPPSSLAGNPGKFDWKARSDAIAENISRAGMNPADFGCLEKGAAVSPGYSWRGHAKMVCSRLSTNADPAIPEQMGCPPVSWKGWRS